MYGRADGMPSFQLTVAVCACEVEFDVYEAYIGRQQNMQKSVRKGPQDSLHQLLVHMLKLCLDQDSIVFQAKHSYLVFSNESHGLL
jgi:hypothetical protein